VNRALISVLDEFTQQQTTLGVDEVINLVISAKVNVVNIGGD